MRKLTLFYLKNCPYCKKALEYYDILIKEKPEYENIHLERIEESRNPSIAAGYDYYYVPAFYLGETKLWEGAMNKSDVKNVLETALGDSETHGF